MTVTRESRRMSRVTPREIDRDNLRDVRRESRDPYPTRPYPTLLNYVGHLALFTTEGATCEAPAFAPDRANRQCEAGR